MHKAGCRLPKKASELIRLALKDLGRAEKSPAHRINMNIYHANGTAPTYDAATCEINAGEPCEVCLAGSVIAFSLKAPPHVTLNPESFDKIIGAKLEALDCFRCGFVQSGLEAMGVPDRKATKIANEIGNLHLTSYNMDPDAFKKGMLRLAAALERAGQ